MRVEIRKDIQSKLKFMKAQYNVKKTEDVIEMLLNNQAVSKDLSLRIPVKKLYKKQK